MGFGGPKIGTSIHSFHRAKAPKNEAPDGRLHGRNRPQWKSMKSSENRWKNIEIDEKSMKIDGKAVKINEKAVKIDA